MNNMVDMVFYKLNRYNFCLHNIQHGNTSINQLLFTLALILWSSLMHGVNFALNVIRNGIGDLIYGLTDSSYEIFSTFH